MTGERPPSRLQIAQLLVTHVGHHDFDHFVGLLSSDVQYRVGGRQALTGVFRGRDEVAAHVRELVERTDGTYDPFKWEDWLVGDQHVAALVDVRAQGHGARIETRLVFVLRFDAADQVSEITVFFEDSSVAERFFGP